MAPKNLFQKIIEYSFYALFFVTPFILTTNNFELFEFPKMLFVYGLTIIITASFLALSLVKGKLEIKLSFLLLPLIFFLLSQFASTLTSIDPHTSLWGYYSRFHGGLISTLCYSLLFIVFISSASKRQVKNSFISLLSASCFISLYAIGEHFGIDANFWVQDVVNRVFSTLGQPNWLAAYLAALFPLTLALFLKPSRSPWPLALFLSQAATSLAWFITFGLTGVVLPISSGALIPFLILFGLGLYLALFLSPKVYRILPWTNSASLMGMAIILELAILFTKSRSGILALVVSFGFFLVLVFLSQNWRKLTNKLLIFSFFFAFLILLIGTEWTPTLSQLLKGKCQAPVCKLFLKKEPPITIQPVEKIPKNPISKSTDIRRAVWEGGLNVYYHYPIFGSGVETFAYSYYNHRVRSHNDTSEWDFLYNKAHNEYLNFLATTGQAGTAALFCFILGYFLLSLNQTLVKKPFLGLFFLSPFLFLFLPLATDKIIIYPPLLRPLFLALALGLGTAFLLYKIFKPKSFKLELLQIGLLSGFLSILITNYYGFSVVCVALLFFLYPALSSVLYEKARKYPVAICNRANNWLVLILIFILSLFLLYKTFNYWRADKNYNQGRMFIEAGQVIEGITKLEKAINLRPKEALYRMELAEALSLVAFSYHAQDASKSSELVDQYLKLSQSQVETALFLNRVHLNFYKSAAKVYVVLANIEPGFFQKALETLLKAEKLSPTDPKITLNLGLLYQQAKENNLAQAYFEKTVKLKPDYRLGWMTLGNFYLSQNKQAAAKEAFEYILKKINPDDGEAREKLEGLEKS